MDLEVLKDSKYLDKFLCSIFVADTVLKSENLDPLHLARITKLLTVNSLGENTVVYD